MTTFRTTEAFLSGAICGHLYWPADMAGMACHVSLRGPFGLMDRFVEPASFREALELYLTERGLDFQDAAFAADTRLVVIRKRIDGPGRCTVHVWERDLTQLAGLVDLVRADTFAGDFFGEEE